MLPGFWRGEVVCVGSAASDQHPGQHDLRQEVGAAERARSEGQQKPRPETAGAPSEDEGGRTCQKMQNGVMAEDGVTRGFPFLLQTQSTLLQMATSKTKKAEEDKEPPADLPKQAEAPPPASENQR